MKKQKTIEIHEFPQEFQNKIAEKMNHCGGHCHWYPGDGFFKPESEVRDRTKILRYNGAAEGYIYEVGDDPISDWLMKNHKIKLIEEVLII